MVKIETRCRIRIWRMFGRIPWHVIPEPPATLQGVIIPSAIVKLVFAIFYFILFFNAFWSLMIGGFRIVSDTLVIHVVLTVRCTKMLTQAKEYVVVIAESIAQTSIKAYNRNRKLSGIGIRISGLIRIRFRMSAGSLPKRCRFIILSTCRHFAECRENMPAAVWEMLINLLKSLVPQWWGKRKSDSESVSGTGPKS